ncbi:MAG: response regulator [Lachnospiraceae bacterium]|nr:response regulator [Lachnospiraceae bacterium]
MCMKKSNFKIGKRNTLIIIFLVSFMIAIGAFMSLRLVSLLHKYMEKQVARQSTQLADMVNLRIDLELVELKDTSAFISKNHINIDYIIEAKQKAADKGVTYGILDVDGNAVVGESLSMTQYPCVRNAFRGNADVSFKEGKGLLFAVPVFNEYNVRYVLYKKYDTSCLNDKFDLSCYDGKGRALVCDENGTVIVAFDGWEEFFYKIPLDVENKLHGNLNSNIASAAFVMTPEEDVFYFIAEIPDTELHVLGYVPSDVVAEGLSYIISLIVWIYGLLLLLFIVGSVYLAGMEEKARESDELREAKEIAERASNTRGAFLANMSHEIRTPINAVMSLNEMILRETKEAEIKDYALKIQNASQSLLGIVNDVLDFSKIDSGKMELVPVPYNLIELISALVNMIKIRAENKGLELKFTISENLPTVLHGDDVRMRQIIVNLLTNAVKYTDKGCVELIIDGEMKNKQNSRVLNMHVEVRDSGVGIKSEDMKDLFRTFRRIEESRNRTIEGSGLGLTISSRLLNSMGSELMVESEYGVGSTFYFDVEQLVIDATPVGNVIEKLEESLDTYTYKETFTARNAQILAIDDVEINLFVFNGLLKKTEIQIDTATSGKEALEMMAQKKYDLVFIDHMMPEMDGVEVLHRMRRRNFMNEGTPAIAFSANAIVGAHDFYLIEGFTDFLEKPVDGNKLENMLKTYLPKDKIDFLNEVCEKAEIEIPKEIVVEEEPLLDEKTGIRFSGSEVIFHKVITTFTGSAKKDKKEISDLYDRRDYQNYIVKIHGLKSAARIAGAPKLSKLAERLEFAGKAGDYEQIHQEHEELLKLYEKTVLEMRVKYGLKVEDELFTGNPIDEKMLLAKLELLSQCNESFDYDTVDNIMNDLMSYKIPDYIRADMFALKDAVYDVDQMQIEEIVSECIRKLQNS